MREGPGTHENCSFHPILGSSSSRAGCCTNPAKMARRLMCDGNSDFHCVHRGMRCAGRRGGLSGRSGRIESACLQLLARASLLFAIRSLYGSPGMCSVLAMLLVLTDVNSFHCRDPSSLPDSNLSLSSSTVCERITGRCQAIQRYARPRIELIQRVG